MTARERVYGETALLTPANLMTFLRLGIAPVLVYFLIYHRTSWWTVLLGAVAAASDYFDGIVARRYGTTTSGAYLDPLADKLIVLGGLYALIFTHPHHLTFVIVPAVIITLREVWMSIHRSRAAKVGISIPAVKIAKWKTFVQDWAIAFCVLPYFHEHLIYAQVTLWLAVGMTVYTGWRYYVDGKKLLANAR